MEEDDDGRREAAIASVPSLQPNFTSKKGLNPAQISKFQELHRRRLKIKARSKVKDKSKGTLAEVGKYHGKDVNAKCLIPRRDGKGNPICRDISFWSLQCCCHVRLLQNPLEAASLIYGSNIIDIYYELR
ncbi:uncharacterized protein LOC107762068 isoform X5 [Nicotiana tabacum]|uniref:Uncharacterized protein LOC107762068 isoform X5 n=1 Tax=Nicotiana tabacum TaxID=4097 RepID=A0A1S3X789_TOBAC|nr:PREDICTED: uncharacterized protein LOC107762068 isoform X5 [Nicotiana tabacum]XP_033514121.1 uncharacterized protein LOC104104423 isoform X7 [Nicotiana tomentosiformis]